MAARRVQWDHQSVGATVVIVDDHAPFRRLARRLLEADGLTVLGEAGDAASALRLTAQLDPDIVLVDVLLPDEDGFAVAAALAGARRSPVVILTSSRDAADFGVRLTQSRASGFVHKDDLSGESLLALAWS
jgi:DNA-binding NarL/FixJ family response regulator